MSYLRANDTVLDVGCGSGMLGKAILGSPDCPAGVRVLGLESHKRGGEAIEVREYDGRAMPFPDDSMDVVILADVLHHENDPDHLVSESLRVTRRTLFIKDHKIDGFLAQQRVAFLDWAANTGYDVKCLFRYHTAAAWSRFLQKFPVRTVDTIESMNLYPPFFNLAFGRRLHYCAVLEKLR